MGRERYDIVIEATDEPELTDETKWKSYEFKCAPGDVTRRPPFITLYHHHLDWQIWFSAMRPRLQEEWLLRLAVRLLENDPQITALLKSAPFGTKRPTYIKMDLLPVSICRLEGLAPGVVEANLGQTIHASHLTGPSVHSAVSEADEVSCRH